MNREFVPYRLALKLKSLGFDEPCLAFYQREYAEAAPVMVDDDEQYRRTGWRTCKNSEIPEHYGSAPTLSQAFRWFRENYSWTIEIKQITKSNWSYTLNNFPKEITYYGELYDTYEEAELACLEKLIEIVESKSE